MKLFNFKKTEVIPNKKNDNSKIDPFINIGNIVRDSRIKKNLSIEELSFISKIPISTIIGIENNMKELIPQYPFLRSVLLKLEEYLLLEKFKLINLAEQENIPINKRSKRDFTLNKFDIFNTWIGSFLYLLLILVSIFVLNSYYINKRFIEIKYIEKINN